METSYLQISFQKLNSTGVYNDDSAKLVIIISSN